MRELIFRQKIKAQHVKIYGDKFHYWGFVDEGFVTPLNTNIAHKNSEQYTGLKDKNGKMIFEGDIIKAPRYFGAITHPNEYNIGKVIFYNGEFSLNGEFRIQNPKIEVIGNIHKTPELLEAGK